MARLPYTNFHDINLDWLIKRVMPAYTPDNPPPYPVRSVNGKTGVVQLTGGDIPFSENFPQASVMDFCDYALQEIDNLNADMSSKQDAPILVGSPGQVLGLDADQNPVWITPSAGVTDYNDLQNKPEINGVTVSGNKTGTDFGLLNAARARMMYAPIITDTALGDPANFPDGIADMPMSILANIVPDQDLHGYTNPWPGGGGKNLLNYADYSTSHGITSITDNGSGEFTVIASILGAYIDHLINVEAGETYYIKAVSTTNVSGNAIQMSIANVYDGNNDTYTDLINHGSIVNGKWFIPTGNVILVRNFVTGGSSGGTGIIKQPQLEKGSSPTTYAPFSNICPISGNAGLTLYASGSDTSDPETNLVAWGDVAGTIYGGTFNAKTGKLTVTHGIVDLGTLNYTKYTNGAKWLFYANILGGKASVGSGNPISIYCSDYKCYTTAAGGSSAVNRDDYSCSWDATLNQILINDSRYTDKDTFKAAMNGVQLVFELATPVEYTLYSFDIDSLYGENNVWTDVGPVSVDYYADTKLYIDKQVAALQALILEI